MQSSTAIAFRALVMLVCMISIPLFAIFGRDLPQIVKNLLAGRLVIRVTDTAAPNQAAAATAPGNVAANSGPLPNNPFAEPAPYRAAPEAGAPAAVRPVAAPAKAASAASPGDWRADVATPSVTQPAGFQAAPESRPISPASPDSTSEQFHKAEARLRELGATHYMLETWGADNNRYRFVCKMSVGGNPEVNRYFQAIEDDPWKAMQAVLTQVETWRTQSRP